MKILLVDDDPEILRMVEQVIRSEGHEVVACSAGAQALNAALTKEFDLLVADIMLPDINGLELVRAIKSQAPNLPVIVISAMDPTTAEMHAMSAGAARFLGKPLRFTELRAELSMANAARVGLKVALADKDAAHGRRMARELRSSGCEVLAVKDLSKVQEELTAGAMPNLLILDAGLPNAKDVVAWARSHKVTCFVMAASPDAALEEQLMRAGAALILPKPVNSDHLLTQARFLALG